MRGPEDQPGVGFPDREDLTPEWREFFGKPREKTPFYEMAAEGEAKQITHAVRMRLAWMEEAVVIENQSPNTYPAMLMGQDLRERHYAIKFSYPLGLADWPKNLEEKGYNKDPIKRKELTDALDQNYRELSARVALLEKVQEQLAFSSDVEQYLFQYFIRFGKKSLPSAYYGVILNSKETHEGFVPLGQKVERALDAFREIGEGKATVSLENGKVKKLPNIFSLPPHRGLIEFALNRYVLPKIKELRSIKQGQVGEAKALEDFDDFCASILGLELFRHFDYDVYYCFGRKGSGESLDKTKITAEDWKHLNLEIGVATGDSAKAMYFEIRRATEWGRVETGGTGRREHPRPAGIPMSFGCYPILTMPMLEIVTTQMPVTDGILSQIQKKIGNRKFKPINKISLSIEDRCHKNQVKVPVKVLAGNEVNPRTGKKENTFETKYVEVSYTPIPLRQVDWDEVQVIETDVASPDWAFTNQEEQKEFTQSQEWIQFALGPQTDAFEVPYKLQGFYAYKDMYSQFMRTDYLKLFEEVVGGDSLLKMNKGIDNALGILSPAFNLSESTLGKLNNYVRCVFLGTLAAAVVPNAGRSPEQGVQINQSIAKQDPRRSLNLLMEAVKLSGFLPLTDSGEIEKNYVEIVKQIQEQRKAPLPSQCQFDKQEMLFAKEEIEELKALYPLGL